MTNVTQQYHDLPYLELLREVFVEGVSKEDRTGVGTISIFGHQMQFDIQHCIIPLLTTKKMHLPSIIHEIIWYLSGSESINYLRANSVRIWDEWATLEGHLSKCYGYQWRHWVGANGKEIDQIQAVINTLNTNPDSRRIIVSAWNVGDLDEMALPPCHYAFQFYSEVMTHQERISWWRTEVGAAVDSTTNATQSGLDFMAVPKRYLSCILNQRSADTFLGVPFNIAQYSIITCLIAKIVGMAPKKFIWSGADCHIYNNHHEQVKEQLSRTPYTSPRLIINPAVTSVDNLQFSDFEIVDYRFHPTIKAKVAV